MGEDEEQQYMRVPKEHAEAVMGKLADAGLIDEEAEVRWEGDFVSFPLISGLSPKDQSVERHTISGINSYSSSQFFVSLVSVGLFGIRLSIRLSTGSIPV